MQRSLFLVIFFYIYVELHDADRVYTWSIVRSILTAKRFWKSCQKYEWHLAAFRASFIFQTALPESVSGKQRRKANLKRVTRKSCFIVVYFAFAKTKARILTRS